MKDRTQEYMDLMDEIQFNGELAYWNRPHRWYDHRPWCWIVQFIRRASPVQP